MFATDRCLAQDQFADPKASFLNKTWTETRQGITTSYGVCGGLFPLPDIEIIKLFLLY